MSSLSPPKRRLTPEQEQARRRLYTFWCWLYIALGLVSIAGGIFLLTAAQSLGGSGRDSEGVKVVGIVLIVFGLLRIANSVYVLRQMTRRRPPRYPDSAEM